MKRQIFLPTLYFCSGFYAGAEYRLYFDRAAQAEQESLEKKESRVRPSGRIWRFMNNSRWQ